MTRSDRSEEKEADRANSFAARLRTQYGEGVDPKVSLDGEQPAAPSGATNELLSRLSEHGPKAPRYRLEGEVARGGMGAILRVWDEDLRRHLAMKVVLGKGNVPGSNATPTVDTRVLARFLEEAQVTGQLDHPGIVPVHELGLDADGRVYFTMKLVKGRDLGAIFDLVFRQKEGWNETRALGVLLKVCEAMAYAHTKGVIHRDLKPANVMVGGFGEVFVMDWGLARVLGRKDAHDMRLVDAEQTPLDSVETERSVDRREVADSPILTMDGDVMGTPAYMPPEQARGEVEKLSARSDVYAVGAMIYHLLARYAPNMPPDARTTNMEVLLHVQRNHPPRPLREIRKDVPEELVAICEKAMALESDRRYPDTLTLAEDLRAYLEHRVVGAYETGAWAETKKWVQRNKPLAAALLAAVVLLVAGLSTSLVYKGRSDAKAVEAAEQARIARASEAVAERERQRATEQEHLATQKANDVLSLSAIQELKELVESADLLWPAFPENVGAYDAWLARAKVLVDGRAADPSKGITAHPGLKEHEAKLAEVRKRAKSPAGPNFEFDDPQDRWWHAQLAGLVDDLREFADETKGGLYSAGTSAAHGWGIVKRRQEAATIAERSTTGADAKARWDEAIDAIAKSPKYGGMKLAPQIGLLPIGEDPDSHLWEFAHLQTGAPARREADGKLTLDPEMGVVLVLLPHGKFWLGAQRTDESGQNYDADANDDEAPVVDVELDAFFVSKFEMTQAQWLRFVGKNPSQYTAGADAGGKMNTFLNPVEQVSWGDCMETMHRLGLVLPTEAQWEYGARAGATTVRWTGNDRASMAGAVNLADKYCRENGGPMAWVYEDWLDDGRCVHAPVGSYRANAFGLHDVIGNVWEWCRDGDGFYAQSLHEGDGQQQSTRPTLRVRRGGGFSSQASAARSAYRESDSPADRYGHLGLRPARVVEATGSGR